MNLASWLLNPWMLGAGALAVTLPVLIHLLNKRRFKIVDWAAMDFLLDADKKNRRRVRLEDLILLLLRCLAMLLIGLMLARPFLPSQLAQVFSRAAQYEWVVWLDDSFSQRVREHQVSQFDSCKDALRAMMERAIASDSDEYLTLLLASQPGKPVVAAKRIAADTLSELLRIIDELECTDRSADYPRSLEDLGDYLAGQREDINRIVFLFSDLRLRDWSSESAEQAPNEMLKKIAGLDTVAGCFVIDSGNEQVENLAITDVRSDELQVANTVIRYDVTVANRGALTARDVDVRLQVGETAPQINRIAELAPGQSVTLAFPFMFTPEAQDEDDQDLDRRFRDNQSYRHLRVELATDAQRTDALADDDTFDYVAPILNGIPVLFVDGEPNIIPERGETYFLEATEVQGTGLLAETVTHSEFESVSLSKYQVIFLCNVGEVSRDRLLALEQWVRDGGGLVIMPGAQVRAAAFNDVFFRQGEGLSPIRLLTEQGDYSRQNFCGFELAPGGHPAFRVALSLNNLFSSLKVYRWWTSEVAEGQLGTTVAIPLRLTDETRSIGMAERSFGKGRVLAFSFPADLDWTDWPPHPSYAPVVFDLIHYLSGGAGEPNTTRVGESFSQLIDLSVFESGVAFVDPDGETTESLAQPVSESEASSQSVLYQARLSDVGRRGVYQLKLRRSDGQPANILFAANLDPTEGDLRRLETEQFGSSFWGDRVSLIALADLGELEIAGGQNELWLQVLIALAALLFLEQLIGWWFGHRRSRS
jgi:hypothetical protein